MKIQFIEMGEILNLIMSIFKKPHVDTEAEIKYFMKRVPQSYNIQNKKKKNTRK